MTTYELIRSLGLVAYLAFSVSVGLGIASRSGGLSPRALDRRIVRQLVHRSAAVLGLVALAAHLGLIVSDSYITTTIGAVLIPFTSAYRTTALGLGSVAMYGFVVAAVSGWARLRIGRIISERGWRWVHRVAYGAWVLSLLHGVTAGPDLHQPWALSVYGIGMLVVAAGFGAHRRGRRHVLRRDPSGAFSLPEAR